MTNPGREHAERRAAQAAAARRPENAARAAKYPGAGTRHRWTIQAEYLAEACAECNADAGEPCRPYCTGKAAHDDAEPFKTGDRVKPYPTGTVADTGLNSPGVVTGDGRSIGFDVLVKFDGDDDEYGFNYDELEPCD